MNYTQGIAAFFMLKNYILDRLFYTEKNRLKKRVLRYK